MDNYRYLLAPALFLLIFAIALFHLPYSVLEKTFNLLEQRDV